MMPDKVTISSGMENNGIAGLGVSLNDKAQTSKPKTLKAKKCATLSRPYTSPNRGNGGCEDSINSVVIQPEISRLRKMIGLGLLFDVLIFDHIHG